MLHVFLFWSFTDFTMFCSQNYISSDSIVIYLASLSISNHALQEKQERIIVYLRISTWHFRLPQDTIATALCQDFFWMGACLIVNDVFPFMINRYISYIYIYISLEISRFQENSNRPLDIPQVPQTTNMNKQVVEALGYVEVVLNVYPPWN